MPLQPGVQTETLLAKLLEMYGWAEQELLTKLAKALTKGIDGEHWSEAQLIEVQRYRAQAEAVLEKLMTDTPAAATEAVGKAVNRGAAVATADIAAAAQAPLVAGAGMATVDSFAAAAVAAELTGTLSNTRRQIFRSVDDTYRRVIADVTSNALLGAQTQRQAAETALQRFSRAGITGYTDGTGRRWEMTTYVESATRTSLMNAATEGHTQRLESYGFDVVVVSDVPQECERCRPFEGKLLTLSGKTVTVTDSKGKAVPVIATLSQAKGRGLFHPNCRHSYSLWTPRTRSFGETADTEGDKARQKLRYLERCVRAAKREELTALTPEGTRKAKQKVAAYQSKIRDHVASTSAKRQRNRESLTAAR
jgi:hypothetical protein